MTRLPLSIPPGLHLDAAAQARIARAARAAAQAVVDVLAEEQRRRWARRWEALARSVEETGHA